MGWKLLIRLSPSLLMFLTRKFNTLYNLPFISFKTLKRLFLRFYIVYLYLNCKIIIAQSFFISTICLLFEIANADSEIVFKSPFW